MQIPEWLYLLGTVLGFAAFLGFFFWAFKSILEDWFSIKGLKNFEGDLALAVKNSRPSMEQILEMAETRNVVRSAVYRSLQRLIREALTGRDAEMREHLSILETYLAKLKEAEPFEGLPDEMRVHLERVREQLPAGGAALLPLASQIRVLVAINEKEQRRQRYYTVGGFFVGMVGVVFAAFSYFYPYSSNASPQAIGSGHVAATVNASGVDEGRAAK